MILSRYPGNPILRPNPLRPWMALNVFNPGVIHHNGLFHMFFRGQGVDYISRIGYAVSSDGRHFNSLEEPVLSPQDDWETRGVEDPRLTYLADEGRFIMSYTAYSARGITPMFAESTNLLTWRRLGPLVLGEDNKDHVLFPRRIGGRYVALHRRPPSIWLAYSDDLATWGDFRILMGPRSDGWDNKRVGGGGVPIETTHGWLMFYHGYDQQHNYRLSVCLLDLDEPQRVIARPAEFILEPVETWELKGDVPRVVFSAANPVVDGTVHVYYGAADRLIALATCDLAEAILWVRQAAGG